MLSFYVVITSLLLFLLAGSGPVCAQVPTGREFIVALPSVLSATERDRDEAGFYIEVLTSRTTVVTARFGDGTFISTQLISNSNRAIFTKPYLSLRRTMQNPDPLFTEVPNRTCVIITTDQPVSVQAVLDTGYRAEAYMVWPTAAYDTAYRVITYSGNVVGDGRNGFVITAGFDGTDVHITPSVNTLGDHPAGGEYLVRLNRNDVYEVKSEAINAGAQSDITGTRIRSSKPIGVTAFSVTNLPRELPGLVGTKPIIEGIAPNGFAGTEFFIAPFYGSTLSIPLGTITTWARFTPLDFNTTIDTNGVQLPGVLNPGGYVDIPVTSPLTITASRPVLAMAFAPSSDQVLLDTTAVHQGTTYNVRIPFGNPMMLWLPALNNWSRSLHFGNLVISRRAPFDDQRANPPGLNLDKMESFGWHHMATIIVPVDAASSVRVDGAQIPFPIIFPGGKYVGSLLSLVGTRHVVVASQPLCALVYGFTWNDSYGTNAGIMPRGVATPRPDTLRFATCDMAKDTTIRIFNTGTGVLRIDSLRTTGIDVTIVGTDSFPQMVAPGGSITATLRFRLAPPGDFNGILRIHSDAYLATIVEMPIILRRDSSRLEVPSTVDFGLLGAGETTRDTNVLIHNRGSSPLIIDDARIIGAGFTLIGLSLPDTIAPGGSDTIKVRLAAATDGPRQATLHIDGGPCLAPQVISLQGFKGSGPVIAVGRSIDYPAFLCTAPSSVDSTLLLRNIGSEPLLIDSARLAGPHAAEFALLDALDGRTLPPGDTTSFRVRYSPTGVGDRRAAVTIHSNASNAPLLTIDLRARRDSAALRSLVDTLDFGMLLSCGDSTSERSIRIRNDGTITDTVTTITIGGGGEYSVTTPLPMIIPPGTEQEIRIRFAPTIPGAYRGTVTAEGSPCGVTTQTELTGSLGSPALAVDRTTIEFDTLFSCDTPAQRTVVLTNGGIVPDTITGILVTGSNAFIVARTFPIVIPPGASDTIGITFSPTIPGRHTATVELQWEPCNGIETINLAGWMSDPSVTLGPDTLDFGSLTLDSTVQRSFVIRNVGDLPRRIQPPDLPPIPGLTVAAPAFPATIPPGDSITIIVEFSPTTGDTLDIPASIAIDDPCGTTLPIRILARVGTRVVLSGKLHLVAPDTVAEVDDMFSLPILVTGGESLDLLRPTSVEFVLVSRASLFDPQSVSTSLPGASVEIIRDRIVDTLRYLRLRLTTGTASLPNDGEILRIRGLALLGDTDRTVLHLDSVVLEVPSTATATVTTSDGSFQTLGICTTGGNRYIRIRRGIVARIVRPNPTRGDAVVEYSTSRYGTVRIGVYDIYQRHVATLQDEAVSGGEHVVIFHAESVASGLYRIELRSGDDVESRWVMVVK